MQKNKSSTAPADASKQESKPGVKASASAETGSASGRWSAVHRARLPHKAGLPLSSGGCGDRVER